MGAPAYPSLALFKALLLQQWYGLSDPGLEEALADRLSFRRFIGLGLSEQVPDHSTLWRFREQLAENGLAERSLRSYQSDREVGLRVEAGTLIDASLVRSAVIRLRRPPTRCRRMRMVGLRASWLRVR